MFVPTMMMQSMWPPMKRHTLNALLTLLTLILRVRISIVHADSNVQTIDTSSLFAAYGLNSGEVHTNGNIARTVDISDNDFYQFNDIDPSQLFADTFKPTNFSEPDSLDYHFNGKVIISESSEESSTETFGEFLKIFSVYPALFDTIPNLMNSRITLKRIAPKPAQHQTHIIRTVKRPISTFNGIADSLRIKLKAIYPGTLWCGDGNYARNTNEIGLFRNTDNCCKHHDQCPAFIRGGSEFKGLRNTGSFTRSHCDCDQKFYNCLKNIDTLISNKIGYTYFNILKPKCFRKEYPIVGCRKWIKNKCYSYTVDNERPPTWQWFDNNLF